MKYNDWKGQFCKSKQFQVKLKWDNVQCTADCSKASYVYFVGISHIAYSGNFKMIFILDFNIGRDRTVVYVFILNLF